MLRTFFLDGRRSTVDSIAIEYAEDLVQSMNRVGDPSRNHHLIEALEKEQHAPVDRVREMFEKERARLDANAGIKTLASVIATRLVCLSLSDTSGST
jgi:hypothetical protein